MKTPLKMTCAFLIGITVIPNTMVSDAMAVNSNFAELKIQQLNAEGRAACRALAGTGYKASIVGIIEASSRSGYANFRIRTCFPTRSQCESFIRNINREVGKIDQIRRAACSPL